MDKENIMWWGSGDASDSGGYQNFSNNKTRKENPEIRKIKEKLKSNISIIRESVEQSIIRLQKECEETINHLEKDAAEKIEEVKKGGE
jgi:hypothetical protein